MKGSRLYNVLRDVKYNFVSQNISFKFILNMLNKLGHISIKTFQNLNTHTQFAEKYENPYHQHLCNQIWHINYLTQIN